MLIHFYSKGYSHLTQGSLKQQQRRSLELLIFPRLVYRAGRYDDNYHLSQYVIMTITVNYHGDIIGNVSNYIFASL